MFYIYTHTKLRISMTNHNQYWLVGANWSGDDQKDAFYRRGYWEMGYQDIEKPLFAQKRDAICTGDRIAIKSMDGKAATTITIHALGIVKEVTEGKVYIDWVIKDLGRKVNSKGVFKTIHGPYLIGNAWIHEVFCI